MTNYYVYHNSAPDYAYSLDMEMVTCLKDGVVDDWEMFENFMDHIYNYALHTESENHPMLMTEPAVNSIC